MPHKLEKLVVDALGACQELRQFTSGKTLDDVLLDRGLQLVIERLFEILGEALYRIRNLDESIFDQITDGHRIILKRGVRRQQSVIRILSSVAYIAVDVRHLGELNASRIFASIRGFENRAFANLRI